MTGDTDALRAALEAEFDRDSREFQPWLPRTPEMQQEQALWQDVLRRRAGAALSVATASSPAAHRC